MNGYIIDCAFTVAFDPQFDPLVLATKEATYQAIKEAGVDVRLGGAGRDDRGDHQVEGGDDREHNLLG